MNYFDLYSSYPDRTIAAAWDSQVKEADNTPWLAGTLTECGDELFARFAACYAELRALPRSARRALQRQLARSSELAAILPEYLQQGGRRLQHRMAWSLAGAALLLALGQGVATAATITVTTNNPNIACGWPVLVDRGHRQRQQRCGDSRRLRGRQRGGHDCPAGKRQRDPLKRHRVDSMGLPLVCL